MHYVIAKVIVGIHSNDDSMQEILSQMFIRIFVHFYKNLNGFKVSKFPKILSKIYIQQTHLITY